MRIIQAMISWFILYWVSSICTTGGSSTLTSRSIMLSDSPLLTAAEVDTTVGGSWAWSPASSSFEVNLE